MFRKSLFRAAAFFLISCVIVSSFVFTAGAVGVLPEKNPYARHIVCTEPSDMAESYYSGEYSYEKLSLLSGAADASTSDRAMKDNPLFDALHDLMADTHTYYTTYSGKQEGSLAYFWGNTDCVESSDNYIMFYSDVPGDGTYQLNREHIWPKSRASFSTALGGADLHHLRPSVESVNKAKSDHTFGYVKGTYSSGYTEGKLGEDVVYYLRTSKDLFECKDDVKGDVARILLYVYCRWEQPNLYSPVNSESLPELDPDDELDNGKPVIESLDTLLQWCALDPVDTWEMERNDLTEEIQGNRNVFIDYPELAWKLFSVEPPEWISTPTNVGCEHNFEEVSRTRAKCVDEGSFTLRCSLCSAEYTRRIAAYGHYDGNNDGVCDYCGAEVVIFADMYRADELHEGDHLVLFHSSSNLSLSTNISDKPNTIYLKSKDGILNPTDSTAVFIVRYADNESFYLTFAGQYLSCDASSGALYLTDEATEYSYWRTTPAASAGKYFIDSYNSKGESNNLRLQVYSKNAKVYKPGTTVSYNFELYTRADHYDDDGVIDPDTGKVTYTCLLCGETHEEQAPGQRLIGDVDSDGDITPVDAAVLQRYLVDIPVASFFPELADTDADGELSVLDVTCIQRWLADIPAYRSVVGQVFQEEP